MTPTELTGRTRSHLVDLAGTAGAVHVDVATPFLNMRSAAAAAGFNVEAVSTFRDFERQSSIWNRKFMGELPLYGSDGTRIDASTLSAAERVAAILCWSALPGGSRHHWGTDLDLIDASAVPPGYAVQLVAAEFAPGGPFAPLLEWLDEHAGSFGFFRPFRGILSGVAPEPWHYSFAPVAEPARRQLTAEVLRSALTDAPLCGKAEILAQLDGLHARYVAAIDWP